jgi:DNA primase
LSKLQFLSTPATGGEEMVDLPTNRVEKESLCRALLAEFGATKVSVQGDELIHSCLLPFGAHPNGDRNPSASLNVDKLAYNCFACGGGGLLWFIGVMRGQSGSDARKWLRKQTGTGGEEQDVSVLLDFFNELYADTERGKAPMPKLNDSILKPWAFIHPYMTEIRHVPEETLRHFKIGYDAKHPIGPPDKRVYSQRIIIPHWWHGQLVGWQSRRILSDGTPKYKLSPEFPRDTSIYNYQGSREAIVVESPLSVLSKWHVDPRIEATFGASVSSGQLRLLANHSKVILWFDQDPAGWKATTEVAEALQSYTSVFVVDTEEEGDPADLTDDEFSRLVGEAIPASIWTPVGG